MVGFASQRNCKGEGCILNRLPYLGSSWQECWDGLTCITEGYVTLGDSRTWNNLNILSTFITRPQWTSKAYFTICLGRKKSISCFFNQDFSSCSFYPGDIFFHLTSQSNTTVLDPVIWYPDFIKFLSTDATPQRLAATALALQTCPQLSETQSLCWTASSPEPSSVFGQK